MTKKLNSHIHKLGEMISFLKEKKFRGHDPYDILNSQYLGSTEGKWLRLISTQLGKYIPLDIRPIFRVKKSHNPKALALFLKSFLKFKNIGINEEFSLINYCIMELLKQKCRSYSNYSWGYGFDWQSKNRFLKRGSPTIVNTVFATSSLLDYHNLNYNRQILQVAKSACDFILKDLNIKEYKNKKIFSYTPYDEYYVNNAIALGSMLLVRVGHQIGESHYIDAGRDAMSIVISKQDKDGMWPYVFQSQSKLYPKDIIDWHQGFILDCLIDCMELDSFFNQFKPNVISGLNFYKSQLFFKNGMSKYRYGRKYPIDIHNQAQGIITFSKAATIDASFLDFSEKILDWTVENMYDKRGFFYYQKWPLVNNKSVFMRWSHAWMMLAQATFLEVKFSETIS